jgi:hypothetical protein
VSLVISKLMRLSKIAAIKKQKTTTVATNG